MRVVYDISKILGWFQCVDVLIAGIQCATFCDLLIIFL